MSSDTESALRLLLFGDYMALAFYSVVGYDYVLMFSREVDYVWRRQWTWGSTIYVLIRYFGLFYSFTNALFASSFVPGPVKTYASIFFDQVDGSADSWTGTALYFVAVWTFQVFLIAADLMMILRVYAMWDRSKWILSILLGTLAVQTAISIFVETRYYNPNTYVTVTIAHVRDRAYCNAVLHVPWILYSYVLVIPRLILGALLFILALTQGLRESLRMYQATKQWQPNRYIRLFVKDGILYFLVNMAYNISVIAQNEIMFSSFTALLMGEIPATILFPVMPRFIIGVRELYDREHNSGRCGIDSGFGIGSRHTMSQSTTMSAMAFAEVAPEYGQTARGDAEDSEVIQLEAMRGGACEA